MDQTRHRSPMPVLSLIETPIPTMLLIPLSNSVELIRFYCVIADSSARSNKNRCADDYFTNHAPRQKQASMVTTRSGGKPFRNLSVPHT
jgi:hypothetical protein